VYFSTVANLNDQWSSNYTVSQKKLDPFSFEHNFCNYCLILIILSLLQTEINCDQMYPKIYHHTSNLLVHYLVKWTRMYWPKLLASPLVNSLVNCSRLHQTPMSRHYSSSMWRNNDYPIKINSLMQYVQYDKMLCQIQTVL